MGADDLDRAIGPRLATWVLVLGGAGFAAGFFGPMLLRPDANQGPMLGIFITGPLGALLGLVMGAAFRAMRASAALAQRALRWTAALGVLAILFASLPEPETQAHVYDAKVLRCQRTSAVVDATIEHWEKKLAAMPWAQPRAGWREDLERLAPDSDGVVLSLQVDRQTTIRRHRKPWSFGRVDAAPWNSRPDTMKAFVRYAGSACDGYEGALPLLHLEARSVEEAAPAAGDWPPRRMPDLLDIAVLEPLPERYASLVAR